MGDEMLRIEWINWFLAFLLINSDLAESNCGLLSLVWSYTILCWVHRMHTNVELICGVYVLSMFGSVAVTTKLNKTYCDALTMLSGIYAFLSLSMLIYAFSEQLSTGISYSHEGMSLSQSTAHYQNTYNVAYIHILLNNKRCVGKTQLHTNTRMF